MEPLPDLGSLTDDELHDLIGRLEDSETELSKRRKVLHGRIDRLRAERIDRLRVQVAAGTVELPLPERLERPLYAGSGELTEESELEVVPDLSTVEDEELRTMIRDLEREEDDVSLERRVLQGQIDIARAERRKRIDDGHVGPGDLGSILGRGPGGG